MSIDGISMIQMLKEKYGARQIIEKVDFFARKKQIRYTL